MCLITEQKKPIKIRKDRVVYKAINKSHNGELSAWSENYSYELGVLNKETIKADNNPKSFFDDIVPDAYNFDELRGGLKEFRIVAQKLTNVHEGFHWALNTNRLKYISASIFKCTIPAGSLIYLDKTGLGVSNQIIINKQVS